MWTLRRRAARTVVLDGDDRALLIEARDPADASKGIWWELPGGGVEGDESTASAAAREAYEETGLDVVVGDCVWLQQARYTFGGLHFDQQEHVHVARWSGVPTDGYRPGGLESLEAQAFSGVGWYSLDELDALVAGGGRIRPPWLPVQLRAYLTDGPTGAPLDMGELGDVFR